MFSSIEGIAGGAPGFQAIIVFALNCPKNQGGVEVAVTECDL
jgi:hypothetical protein